MEKIIKVPTKIHGLNKKVMIKIHIIGVPMINILNHYEKY
jgi:hypothetical protein